jgi:hypothetical protein
MSTLAVTVGMVVVDATGWLDDVEIVSVTSAVSTVGSAAAGTFSGAGS